MNEKKSHAETKMNNTHTHAQVTQTNMHTGQSKKSLKGVSSV